MIAVDTPVPSQFSHEISECESVCVFWMTRHWRKTAGAVRWRCGACCRESAVLEEVGGLDAGRRLRRCGKKPGRSVRDADELHDVLRTVVALPEG